MQNLITILACSAIGLSGGLVVAAGLYAFLSLTGMLYRMIALSHTMIDQKLYKWVMVAGAVAGNYIWLFGIKYFESIYLIAFLGLVSGIYLGCVIGAITEVIRILPILSHLFQLEKYLQWLIILFAVGKMAGAFIWY